jgi:hypothetical protein
MAFCIYVAKIGSLDSYSLWAVNISSKSHWHLIGGGVKHLAIMYNVRHFQTSLLSSDHERLTLS